VKGGVSERGEIFLSKGGGEVGGENYKKGSHPEESRIKRKSRHLCEKCQ